MKQNYVFQFLTASKSLYEIFILSYTDFTNDDHEFLHHYFLTVELEILQADLLIKSSGY